MHFKFIDLVGGLFRLNDEQILPDFLWVEHYRILEDRDVLVIFILLDLAIEVNSLHDIRVETVEHDSFHEDLIDRGVGDFDLQEELIILQADGLAHFKG
eukprot:CAMPEP_0170547926 /NCGR_PEP_ID=MMETSP0211-20121228/6235_1 /TAXON_ID=311385 /ORGANISM="Pseudokeronopsis sp., Strain OXSARD2" /LENGTH=98 /DNA_ID=CAMNT_0010853153 /DNA_START=368 /DNA_END=664 /DNA_ORIENTATION=-